MTEAERLSRRRSWLLLVNGIAFAIWHLADMKTVKHAFFDGVAPIFVAVPVTVWLVTLVALFRLGRNKPLPAAMEDELTQLNRRNAFATGYWVTILLCAALMVLVTLLKLPDVASDLLRLVLLVGVSTPIILFALSEMPGGRGEAGDGGE